MNQLPPPKRKSLLRHWEAKRNHLIDKNKISRELQLELKGLVAQQCTEIKHGIKSMYENNHMETITDIGKEISYLNGEIKHDEYKSTSIKFS